MIHSFTYDENKLINAEALPAQIAAAFPTLFQSLDTERGRGVDMTAPDTVKLRITARFTRTLTTTEENTLAALLDAHDPGVLTESQQQRTALAAPGAGAVWTAINNADAQTTWAAAKPFLIPVLRWCVKQIMRILIVHGLTEETEPT